MMPTNLARRYPRGRRRNPVRDRLLGAHCRTGRPPARSFLPGPGIVLGRVRGVGRVYRYWGVQKRGPIQRHGQGGQEMAPAAMLQATDWTTLTTREVRRCAPDGTVRPGFTC